MNTAKLKKQFFFMGQQIIKLSLAAALLVSTSVSHSMTEAEYNQGVDEINARYKATYDKAKKEGDDIKKESKTCIVEGAFDADWEITKVSFDVPEVTFKNRDFSFHTVKTTFRKKTILETKVLKTSFKNKHIAFGIKTKVPVFWWDTTKIIIKVPEFKWDKTSFSTKIPEFKKKRVEWKFHILKLKNLKKLNIPCKEEEERAEDLSASVSRTAKKHKQELNQHSATYLEAQANNLANNIAKVEKEFDAGIAAMDKAIAEARTNKVDPAGVTIDFYGKQTNMIGARDILVQKKLDALTQMKASHQQTLNSIQQLTS